MKVTRKRIFDKFGGRCAYCGVELGAKWQIDHMIPKHLVHFGTPPHVIEHENNLMPSCPSCNNYKRAFTLEKFRDYVQQQPEILRRDRSTVRMAERFGLLTFDPKPVVFYFERYENGK